MHPLLASLCVYSSLFPFFLALDTYSQPIYRETKQFGLIPKGWFQRCVGEKIAFHSLIRKQTCLCSHPSSMLVPTDRQLSYHSGLAATLFTAAE